MLMLLLQEYRQRIIPIEGARHEAGHGDGCSEPDSTDSYGSLDDSPGEYTVYNII